MGCGTHASSGEGGAVAGCGSGGSCSSGGCNRMNVFNWFADMPISFNENYSIVEISFKSGSRKGFYRNNQNLDLHKGQIVVVEAAQGYDVGEVSLQGELVKAQMKKKRVTERDDTIRNILRVANEQDVKVLEDARSREPETMVRARAIARTYNLDMKIGDIEFQGDYKKVTIFYTADDRVDFRELVKVYAKEFKVKIEMRQIGARQEAARIGGVGSCGRELCCSTWLNDFKSVTTQAVRYQNLAINTDKLSGQCGRLKCCLNYELDTYNDALRNFPKNAERLETEEGTAYLKKTEILKRLMWYEYAEQRGNFFKLTVDDVKDFLWQNKQGKKPKGLVEVAVVEDVKVDESKHEDLVGQVSLATLEQKDRKKKQHHKSGPKGAQQRQGGGNQEQRQAQNKGGEQKGQQQGNRQQGNNQNRPKGEQQNKGGEQQQNRNQNQQPRTDQKRDGGNGTSGGGRQNNEGKGPQNQNKGGGHKKPFKPNQNKGNNPNKGDNNNNNNGGAGDKKD